MGAAAAIAPIVGSVIGNQQAQGQLDAANSARRQALNQFSGIDVPTVQSQEVNYNQLQSQGDYNPEMYSSVGDLENRYENIDPRLQQAQLSALQQMSDIASQGGLTQADQSMLNQIHRSSAADAQAKQNQILQDMAQRGIGGSGNELIARLKGAQSAIDRQSQEQDRVAQEALARKLQAIQSQSSLAAQAQSSDLARLNALSSVDQFNLQNRQNLANQNIGTKNQAQQTNLQEKQRLADYNTTLQNQQQQQNKALLQQQFQNKLQKASGIADRLTPITAANERQAANTAGMWAGIGQGVGTGLAGLQKKNTNDPGAF